MSRHESRKRRSPFLSLSFRLVATVCCILLLLSYVSVLIDPGIFPLAGFFGLYFIPMLAVNVLLLVLALLRWSSSAWIPVIALLPSLFFVGFFFRAGDRNALPESVVARTDGLKVLTWNVGGFRSGVSDEVEDNIRGVTALVASESPDVVSLQEFRTGDPSGLRRMFPGYPHVREHFFQLRNGDYVGNVTFSRLPLRGDGHLPYDQHGAVHRCGICREGPPAVQRASGVEQYLADLADTGRAGRGI
jgi:hypothetical protein